MKTKNQKPKTKNPTRGVAGRGRTAFGFWLSALGFCAGGCSLLTPGLDTRVAAEANSDTVWDKESNLRLRESTTHNRRIVAAEGDDVNITYYPDGTPYAIDGATMALSQMSEPRDVMQAYMALAVENAKVAARIMDTLERVLPLVIDRYAPAPGPPAMGSGQLVRRPVRPAPPSPGATHEPVSTAPAAATAPATQPEQQPDGPAMSGEDYLQIILEQLRREGVLR